MQAALQSVVEDGLKSPSSEDAETKDSATISRPESPGGTVSPATPETHALNSTGDAASGVTSSSRTTPVTPAKASAQAGGDQRQAKNTPDAILHNYEPHYGLASRNVQDIIEDILEDMSSYKHIHSWVYKAGPLAHENLAGVVRKALVDRDMSLNMTTMMASCTIEKVMIDRGVAQIQPQLDSQDLYSCLFFTKAHTILSCFKCCMVDILSGRPHRVLREGESPLALYRSYQTTQPS
jgi:hypothetical protein